MRKPSRAPAREAGGAEVCGWEENAKGGGGGRGPRARRLRAQALGFGRLVSRVRKELRRSASASGGPDPSKAWGVSVSGCR